MANTVRQSSDLRYSNPAFGLFWIISELRSWVTFLHYFTFYAVDIHDIRLLAPYDHFEIWRSLGPKWRDKLLCNLNLNQPNLQISWTSCTLWETFCSRSISNPIQVLVVLLGSLVFGKCISACISQLSPGWPDLSLPMDQHHSSLPHGRKLLRILSFSFLPPHHLIITI